MNLIKHYLTKNPYYKRNINKSDDRYVKFQKEGPKGLMLHSVGCAQPSAMVFINNWNKEDYDNACIHAFIDANTGTIYQTMPWNFRAPHCAGSATETHIGVEMCESSYIKYEVGAKIIVKDKAKAQADCKRAYDAAVELFAMLCEEFKLNPLQDIISHNEGGKKGVASKHVDPEHYWTALGMKYTMDGFRQDVQRKMNVSSAPSIQFEVNDLVTINAGAKYYTGKDVPSWVFSHKWYIMSISKDRVVLGKNEKGDINLVSAFNAKDLTRVKPFKPYVVKIASNKLNVRKGPSTRYEIVTLVHKDEPYTIVEEENGWGKLKSGVGWINLKYTKK